MRYGYIGSMKVKPGHRAEVVAVLLAGTDGLRKAGCHLYVVTESATDEDTVWVSEVWESKGHHDASLQLPEAKASITKVTDIAFANGKIVAATQASDKFAGSRVFTITPGAKSATQISRLSINRIEAAAASG